MRSFALLLLFATSAASQPNHIAPTDAKSPEEERKSFKLPPGFAAQLVASEPDIQKPMQHAFDAKGRLWVTTSYHYPFAAEAGKASDKLFILSEFGENGKAKKIEVFDDKLNIPIGILPLPDCKSCIVSSVGEILKLTDTDGDGKADKREVLFTGFGSRDTHGMYNSFTYMPDGWVYACHGFSNESKVKGKDGHEVHMQSGNTFRFRPDGSRIEVYTRGQVNPFGMTVDPWFNLYTADCHSKPITQLIKGAYYDSFGKPHDGLGYAPHVTRHDHGSTALCGLAWYEADHFPKEWNGCMFLGNVVTNRINADKIEWKGSTPVAKELPDFLVSSDPWFRPTDIKLGPDGALYVTDFYNKIIGHYEVDLKHPQRDKKHGRVWRIVATERPFSRESKTSEAKPASIADRTAALKLLIDPSPYSVRNALTYLSDHAHPDNILPLVKLISTTPAEDTHLRHAARIALRNALVADKSQEQIVWLLKDYLDSKEQTANVLDEVFLGVRNAYSGWWLSERIHRGTLHLTSANKLGATAAEHVGRYGCHCHRIAVWNSSVGTPSDATKLGLLESLETGMKAAGYRSIRDANYITSLPGRTNIRQDLEADRAKITSGLASRDLVEVERTLKYGAVTKFDLTLEAMELASNTSRDAGIRVAGFDYLQRFAASTSHEAISKLARKVFDDATTPAPVRERTIQILSLSRVAEDQERLRSVLKSAPYRECVQIATAMAISPGTANELFKLVRASQAPARLLQEPAIVDRLRAAKVPDWERTVKELTAGIPSADARIAALIKERGDGFKKAKIDLEAGKKIFTTMCANCHQIGGQGAKIGPQLDGIGNRGVERLLEDTLDPNRNVDHAFHTTILEMKDGKQLTGLLRVEGKTLIIIDPQAKETRVSVDDVEKKRTSPISPMPSDIAEKLKPQEFYNLIGYLADLRAK